MLAHRSDCLKVSKLVISDKGNALSLAQFGGKHPAAKPWKGLGPGIFEIVEDFDGDTYQAIYTVKFSEVIYVLHAFQKKSKKGIETPKHDISVIQTRLKAAEAHYQEHYGKGGKK